MMRDTSAAVVLMLGAAAVVLSARQTAAPAGLQLLGTNPPSTDLKITSPESGGYVSGDVTLRAEIVGEGSVVNVTFYVDGRQICTVPQAPYECDWDAGADVEEHQIRAVAALDDGARVARTIRTKGLGYVEKVDVPAVQVTVTVTDSNGRFVTGIPRSAFHISEDGKPQTITNFASEDIPLELVSALDISGSMVAAMPTLKKAVKDFLSEIPSKNQVTLLAFNDNIFALTRKSTSVADRTKAVDRLASWGATALYDALVQGIDMLGRQVGRKAIVMFSDGEDQGSHVTLDDVQRRLEASDVTLYMIGEGRGTSVERLKVIMRQLSALTGGRLFATDSIDELHGAFDELLDELSHQYLIGYQPLNEQRDDTWRTIQVEIDGHPGTVRARQGYRASPFR